MDFKKIALGLALTAVFGLVACGDDSSSGPNSDNDSASCKVIDDGKIIGFEYNMYGSSTKKTTTFNSDGSITEYMKAVYRSQKQVEAVCAEAKAEMGDEDFDFFKCENGTIEYEYSVENIGNGNNAKVMAKYAAESMCAEMLGEKMPEKPNFDMFGDEDADDSGFADEETSSDEEFTSPVEDSPVDMDSLLHEIEQMPECTSSNEGCKTSFMGNPLICKNGEWELDLDAMIGEDN